MLKRIFIFFVLLFSLLGIPKIGNSQSTFTDFPIVGNRFILVDNQTITGTNNLIGGQNFRVFPVPLGTSLVLEVTSNNNGVAHVINISFSCNQRDGGDTSNSVNPSLSYIVESNAGVQRIVSGNAAATLQPLTWNRYITQEILCPSMYISFPAIIPTGGQPTDLVTIRGMFVPSTPNLQASGQGFIATDSNGRTINAPYTFNHQTDTVAHTLGVSGNRVLHTVTINTGGAGTLTIFDLSNGACTGTPVTNQIGVITSTATTLQTFIYDVNTVSGLCVKASVAMDYTVSYQ